MANQRMQKQKLLEILRLLQQEADNDCQRVIMAHPTWSEALHEALMDFDQHAIHTLYKRTK